MLHNVSLRAAGYMGRTLQASDMQIHLYAFSLEIALRIIIQVSLYLIVAWFFGVFWNAVFVLLALAGFRSYSGGAQLKIFPRCLLFTGLLTASLVAIALPAWPAWVVYTFAVLSFIYASIVTVKWVPAGLKGRLLRNEDNKRRQKIKTVLFLLFCSIVCAILEIYNQRLLVQGVLMGLATSCFLTTPRGYKALGYVDRLYDCLEGGCRR